MSRREFSKTIKRDAHLRAKGRCECCGMKLRAGEGHVDHIIADGLGGKPTLDNAQVLCTPCHKRKTSTKDVPAIAKTKRIQDRERGIRKAPQLRSAGFAKRPPQRSASRPITRQSY